MIAYGTQQILVDSPKFTIDCVLATGSTQLQADGCVLERLEGGHELITPDHLRAGDLVKVQLWLEGEETFIDIRLAVVSRVLTPWISVEVIQMSQNDRIRMNHFIDSSAAILVGEATLIDHLLIRA
jgi:hypothetical protein